MRFDFVTIFPAMFASYLNESILARAQKNKLIKIMAHDLRRWATDKHKTVDDKPYGGGPGMLMKIEPFYKALKQIKKNKARVILTSAKGKQFGSADAKRLSKYKQIIILCGRYEGVDERVAEQLADEEFSIGNYILTGGELPAMVMADAISRHVPGVLGKAESLEEKRGVKGLQASLGFPQYTRPEEFRKWKVPKVLLSGDHKKIDEWRLKMAKNNLGTKGLKASLDTIKGL